MVIMMGLKNNIAEFFYGVFGFIMGAVMFFAFTWCQFGGVYHAFKHHGTIDGVITVLVPPYSWYYGIEFFFCSERKHDGLSKADKNEFLHFVNSIQLSHQATQILVDSMSGKIIGEIPQEKIEESLSLFRQALRESYNITDKVLAKVHPDFPYHYREEFYKGIELVIQGYEKMDPITMLQAQALLARWENWYSAHIQEIRDRIRK